MKTPRWAKFPYDASHYRLAGSRLEAAWEELHHGDREPWPSATLITKLSRAAPFARWLDAHGPPSELASQLADGWRAFHSGDFGRAIETGTRLGPLGATIANKAAGVYATYLEKDSGRAQELLRAAAERADGAIALLPGYANAHYMRAFVLGRYGQRRSILKALAEGLAARVRESLERTLALEPKHAEAELAFGLFHAEIVSKVGSMAAALTYGASADKAHAHLRRALALAPHSAVIHVEYAHALELLDERRHGAEARELLRRAAAIEALDAMERLELERARSEIA